MDAPSYTQMVAYMEVMYRVSNCLGICHMNTIHWDIELMDLPHAAELFSAATGFPKRKTLVDLGLAEVSDNLEKIGNLR